MTGLVRLLGIGQPENTAVLRSALARVVGPSLVSHEEVDFTAFAQREPSGPRRSLNEAAQAQSRMVVRQRLEAACRAAPFLPANPSAALCAAAELPTLLSSSALELSEALARDGATHQWQMTLRWPVDHWLSAHRARLSDGSLRDGTALARAIANAMAETAAERALRVEAVLAPIVLRVARVPAGETELSFALLVPRGREEIIERGLQLLPQDLSRGGSAELRGPMPPVHFAAWQVAEAEGPALRAVWALRGMPRQIEAEALVQRRLRCAAGRAAEEKAKRQRIGEGEEPECPAPGDSPDLQALLSRACRRLVPSLRLFPVQQTTL